jgi:hypothetical protein
MSSLHRQDSSGGGERGAIPPRLFPCRHVPEIPRVPVLMFDNDALWVSSIKCLKRTAPSSTSTPNAVQVLWSWSKN